jgi:hypothetical protein
VGEAKLPRQTATQRFSNLGSSAAAAAGDLFSEVKGEALVRQRTDKMGLGA